MAHAKIRFKGLQVGGKPLGTLFWGAGKILKTSTSDSVALPLASLGLLSCPSWQLQRNREGTAQWQLWLSFRHSPPWPWGVRPALLPWAPGLWWCNNWALFPTQLQSCLTPLETVRTMRLFLLLQLLLEASTDLTTGSVKRNPGQLSDYSRDGQLNKKVFLLVKRNLSLSLSLKLPSTSVLAARSCPTLCEPMDYSLPGSSVHGILQVRILEWVAISFSRGLS